MKQERFVVDREKKIHKVVKGTNKVEKHKKSIYNMLSDEELEFDNDDELDLDEAEYKSFR